MFSEQDHFYMGLALEQAKLAADQQEVPVGAVVVCDGELLASAFNSPIAQLDPSAHAEVLALRAAAKKIKNYRLSQCELFVTVEPCLMCSGALIHARVKRVVYGAHEPKAGVAHSQLNVFDADFINHQVLVEGGLREQECSDLMSYFFKSRRLQKKKL